MGILLGAPRHHPKWIRMIEPARENQASPGTKKTTLKLELRLRSILKHTALERFVFVMSALEGYSYLDCSILLGCSRQAVANARARALERLANGAEVVATHGMACEVPTRLFHAKRDLN